MTGISIQFTIEEAEARDRLQQMLDHMESPLGFYKVVGNRLVGSAGANFRREAAPDGTPWLSLRPATIAARVRNKQTPLTILRANTRDKPASSLAGSIHAAPSADGVRVGSPTEYAAIHQLGGTIQKPAGKRWMAGRRFAKREEHPDGHEVDIAAHAIRIPARPFLGVSRDDELGILEDAEQFMTL